MLLNLLESYPKNIDPGEAAIDALIGFFVVFIGISILIFIVWLVGLILTKFSQVKEKKVVTTAPVEEVLNEETNDEELVAVITAAISSVYAKENKKAEFVVRKIKKI